MREARRMADFCAWRVACLARGMFDRIRRLFTIKTKFEAFVVTYGLATGAVERGLHYLHAYPGWSGWLMFSVCPIAVFMAGGKILDAIETGDA